MVTSIGINKIEDRLNELTEYLINKLKKMNLKIISPIEKEYRSSIVVIELQNSKEIVEELSKNGIIVSERLNRLRVSLNIFNNKEDIDTFTTELNNII